MHLHGTQQRWKEIFDASVGYVSDNRDMFEVLAVGDDGGEISYENWLKQRGNTSRWMDEIDCRALASALDIYVNVYRVNYTTKALELLYTYGDEMNPKVYLLNHLDHHWTVSIVAESDCDTIMTDKTDSSSNETQQEEDNGSDGKQHEQLGPRLKATEEDMSKAEFSLRCKLDIVKFIDSIKRKNGKKKRRDWRAIMEGLKKKYPHQQFYQRTVEGWVRKGTSYYRKAIRQLLNCPSISKKQFLAARTRPKKSSVGLFEELEKELAAEIRKRESGVEGFCWYRDRTWAKYRARQLHISLKYKTPFGASNSWYYAFLARNDFEVKPVSTTRDITLEQYADERFDAWIKTERNELIEFMSSSNLTNQFMHNGKLNFHSYCNIDEIPIQLRRKKITKQISTKGRKDVQLYSGFSTRKLNRRIATLTVIIPSCGFDYDGKKLNWYRWRPQLILFGSPSKKEQAKYDSRVIVDWNKNAYQTAETFRRYCWNATFLREAAPSLLYYDNVDGHEDSTAVRNLKSNGAYPRTLIPWCTHVQQPIDQEVGRFLQTTIFDLYYAREAKKEEEFIATRTINKDTLSDMRIWLTWAAAEAWQTLCIHHNYLIVRSFRRTGLYLSFDGSQDKEFTALLKEPEKKKSDWKFDEIMGLDEFFADDTHIQKHKKAYENYCISDFIEEDTDSDKSET